MLGIGDGVAKPDIYFLYLGDKVQCTSYQHIKTKQTMIGVENFEEGPTGNCPSQNCPKEGNSEVGNSTLTYAKLIYLQLCDFLKCYFSTVFSYCLLEQMQSHISCMSSIFLNVSLHMSSRIACLNRCKVTIVACV